MEILEDIVKLFDKRGEKPEGKKRVQIALAKGASDIAPTPFLKSFFLKFSNVNAKVGERFGLSPGSRVYDNTIGDDASVGINAYARNCTLEDNVRIGANARVENCTIGKNSIVAANAVIAEDVPENSLAYGCNKHKPLEGGNSESPLVKTHKFDRNPFWYWKESLGKVKGVVDKYAPAISHVLMNYMPQLKMKLKGECNDEMYDYKLRRVKEFCNVDGDNIKIHPTVDVDSVFPKNLTIGNNVTIDEYTLLVTHSFINKEQNTFLEGKVKIGDNVSIGRHCVILPGTAIPDNTKIPSYSAASPKAVYCTATNKRYDYKELKADGK